MSTIKIATRTSELAMSQANFVKSKLLEHNPNIKVELVGITTKGDKILDKSLAKIGGKGLFVKELETLLLSGECDIAVHSMKDVPSELPNGLELRCILQREDPSDAFICNEYEFMSLPPNSKVGTSSLRRKTQLMRLRRDLEYLDLRGNINTRLSKLNNNEFDAIILASCGLKRINLDKNIKHKFNFNDILPAAGQGALGIESRTNDPIVNSLINKLNCNTSNYIVTAERAVTRVLDGGCQAPIAAFARIINDHDIELEARVISIDAENILTCKHVMNIKDANKLGEFVANDLISMGASSLINEAKEYITNKH